MSASLFESMEGDNMEEPLRSARLKEDMIERVRGAFMEYCAGRWPNMELPLGLLLDGPWRAAIEAMREPTDLMLMRGFEALYPRRDALPSTIYTTMIDAALSSPKRSEPASVSGSPSPTTQEGG